MAKKLKKIPSDLVSYIQIETEAIRDSNDKMMISSYCLHKLEILCFRMAQVCCLSKPFYGFFVFFNSPAIVVTSEQSTLGNDPRPTHGMSQADYECKNQESE